MKTSRALVVCGGLLPGVVIGLTAGWMMNRSGGSWSATGEDSLEGVRSAKRSDVSAASPGSDRGARRQQPDGRASGQASANGHMPNFDFIREFEGNMDEMSALMRYRVHKEIARLQSRDFPSVMEKAKLDGEWSGDMLSLLLIRWAEIDPSAAMAFGQNHLSGQEISFTSYDESDWRILIATVDLEMNGENAVTSLEASLQNEDTEDWWDEHSEDMDMFSLYALKAERDPEAVFESLIKREGGVLDSDFLWLGLFEGCFKSGKLPWLVGKIETCDEEMRSSLREGLASRWVKKDLDGAKKWAEKLFNGGVDDVVDEVASEWAGKDPRAAGEWLLSQVPSEESALGVRRSRAMLYFIRDDLDKALQWLDENGQSGKSWNQSKLQAVKALTNKLRYREAFDHLSSITDDDINNRSSAMADIFDSSKWGDAGKRTVEIGKLAEEYGYGEEYRRYQAMRKQAVEASATESKINQEIRRKEWINPQE